MTRGENTRGLMTLYVGERNYSSRSLAAWLTLKWSTLPFVDELISLEQPGYGARKITAILMVSPTGCVPALNVDGAAIWESPAIAEWAAESTPSVTLWPEESLARAQARALMCEMHAGFPALKRDLPMNIRRRCAAQEWPVDTRLEIHRIESICAQYRAQYMPLGPYLFGRRTIADAFFTPFATQIQTYSVTLSACAKDYCQTLLNDSAFLQWVAQALTEWKDPYSRALIDKLYPDSELQPRTRMTLGAR